MKTIVYSTQAKKDLKKYRNDPRKVRKLLEVIRILALGETLPPIYKAHKLIGGYIGCMECHVDGDFLLIWIDEQTDFIEVVRVGSHSELFR